MRPFYKNLKVGDKVFFTKYDKVEIGTIKQILPNPYFQFFWQYPNYLVEFENETGVFKRGELKLIR